MIWNAYFFIGEYGWPDTWDELSPDGHYWRKETWSGLKDPPLLEKALNACVLHGMTHMTIDIKNGVQFPSHPELIYPKAATPEEMNSFVRRAKARGVTVLPMLNLSCQSSMHLGKYARMISTPIYYKVVRDILADIYDIFDHPPFIHIGMDEETYTHVETDRHCAVRYRTASLYYHDANYIIDCVSKLGARPWMFADVNNWHNLTWLEPNAKKNRMLEEISKKVVMSEWVYGNFDEITKRPPERNSALNYNRLEKYGFDQIPTCSGCYTPKNIFGFMKYMKENLDPKKLLGIDVEDWGPLPKLLRNLPEVAKGRAAFWPEEEKRVRAHFKKLNPNFDFTFKEEEKKKS